MSAVTELLQQLVEGVGSGAVYASLALALVLIHRFTGIVNFAQGELAMISTYVAWQLVASGMSFWLALPVTLAVSFAGGMLVERIVIRPVQNAPELTMVIVTVGLFIFVNALAGLIWSFTVKDFPQPFPDGGIDLAGVRVDWSSLGIIAVVAVVMGLLYLLFQHTSIGLVMRAVACHPIKVDMLLPGVTLSTGPDDAFPIETMQLMRFEGERWQLFGEAVDTRKEFGPLAK